MPIPSELISELGVPAAVVVVGLTIYFLERYRKPSGLKVESNNDDALKLWFLENIKDPIMKAIRDE